MELGGTTRGVVRGGCLGGGGGESPLVLCGFTEVPFVGAIAFEGGWATRRGTGGGGGFFLGATAGASADC